MQAIILAAGKGTRFDNDKSKVLHTIAGESLIRRVVNLASAVGINKKIVVIGHQGESVKLELEDFPKLLFAWQKEQKGTGHAVMEAQSFLSPGEDVLILYGDVPALTKETILNFISEHSTSRNVVTILAAKLQDPKWYGRILREENEVVAIREMKDANQEELLINEVNSGVYLVNYDFLIESLGKLTCENQQNEYYLTDIVEIAFSSGLKVGTHTIDQEHEIRGVNSVEELEEMRSVIGKQSI